MSVSRGTPPRRAVEFAGLAGALLAAATGQAIQEPVVLALALACAAACGLGFMLHGTALRLITWAEVPLGVLGVIVAIESSQGWAYLALAGFVVVLVASRIVHRFTPVWAATVRERRKAAPLDPWKQQDMGIDATQEIPDDDDSR